ALTFEHWRIDPEVAPAPTGTETFDGFTPASPTNPTTEHRVVASHQASTHAARKPTMELMSMAVVVGLILGSIVTGAALYKHGVRCSVAARTPGLAVMFDGRDTGARTSNGAVELRLPPGRHVMSLRAQGAPPFGDRQVQVEAGQACE